MDVEAVGLAVATALHAGFQLTVTLLVYPAFSDVPESQWAAAHDTHGRRITPLVGVVYSGLLVACLVSLANRPTVSEIVAIAAVGMAVLGTVLVAMPAHRRLSRAHDPDVLQRLLVVDRWRAVTAVIAWVAATFGLVLES